MGFFKKNIKFYCSLPEVKEKFPILPTKVQKFNWLKQSALAFKHSVDTMSHYQQISGTVKCGGISSIMQKGFIIRSWFDLTIKTGEDPSEFEYFIPAGIHSYLKEKNYDKKIVSWFSADNSAHAVPLAEGDLKSLIKINTPWTVTIPKPWNLCFLPIPYPDNPNFSATSGILESGDKYDISVIIKIHTHPSEIFIPAGTPLCQFIPFRDESICIEFLDLDPRMEKINLQHQYNRNYSFVTKYEQGN